MLPVQKISPLPPAPPIVADEKRSLASQGLLQLPNAAAKPISPRVSTFQTKLHDIWDKFISLLSCSSCCLTDIKAAKLTPAQQMQPYLDNIASREIAFQQIKHPKPTSTEMATNQERTSLSIHWVWMGAHELAFSELKKVIAQEKLNPCQLPKDLAFQLTEILVRFGIAIYANKQYNEPFQYSLNILKAALLVQQYALGLSPECPDISKLHDLVELYENKNFTAQADACIDHLQPQAWAQKVSDLTESQLLYIPKLLRYINGAMRYLKMDDLSKAERLLDTAKACLAEAQTNSKFNKIEVNDQLAELLYNDVTGLVGSKIKRFEDRNELAEAELLKPVLAKLWEDCVTLSKEPEKMRARCYNKRTFVENLTPQEVLRLRLEAVNGHLALPPEKQDKLLFCLAWNNLSHAQEKVGNNAEAAKSAIVARNLATECRAKGIDNIQLDDVVTNSTKCLSRMMNPT